MSRPDKRKLRSISRAVSRSTQSPQAAGKIDNRRELLIRAAAHLFRKNGYNGTKIRDVAALVGMQGGSPYYHFESKQDLLVAVMERGVDNSIIELESVVARNLPPQQKLREMVRAHLRHILEPGNDFVPVLLFDWRSLEADNKKEVIKLRDRYDAIWKTAFEELETLGTYKKKGPADLLLFLGSLNFCFNWFRIGGSLSIDDLANEALSFLLDVPKPS